MSELGLFRLLHDKAPSHSCTFEIVRQFISVGGYRLTPSTTLSYSSSPVQFSLFSKTLKFLSGRSYKSLQTIDSAASHRIRDLFSRAIGRKISSYLQHKFLRALCRTDLIYLSISAYRVAFQKWIQRLKSCISFRGEYFERMSFLFHFLNQFLLRFLYNTRYVLKTLVHMALTRSF